MNLKVRRIACPSRQVGKTSQIQPNRISDPMNNPAVTHLNVSRRWLNPASDRASPITATDSSIKSPDSDLAVVDARDEYRNSVGFVEPKAKEFSIADLRTAFPSAVEICAVNKTGEMSMTILAK